MRFGRVRFARAFRKDLFGLHFADTLVDTPDSLEFIHGLYVHYDFCVRNIEQIRTPSVFYTQRIVRYREYGSFRPIHYVFIGLELNLIRHNPIFQFLVRDVRNLSLIEIPRKTVFQKDRCFDLSQNFRVQTALVDLACYINCQIVKVKFVSAVQHDVVIGNILLTNVIHLVNGVNSFFQNFLLDCLNAFLLNTFFNRRQLLEQISRKLIERYGAVNLHDVRRLRSVQQFQSICKIFDVNVLLNHILDTEILLPDLYHSAVKPIVILNLTVFFQFFQPYQALYIFFVFACRFRIFLFRK